MILNSNQYLVLFLDFTKYNQQIWKKAILQKLNKNHEIALDLKSMYLKGEKYIGDAYLLKAQNFLKKFKITNILINIQ